MKKEVEKCVKVRVCVSVCVWGLATQADGFRRAVLALLTALPQNLKRSGNFKVQHADSAARARGRSRGGHMPTPLPSTGSKKHAA